MFEHGLLPRDIASMAGVHLATVYAWLVEEENSGRVRTISGEALGNLIDASKGKLTADNVLGTLRKRKVAAR